MKTLYKINASNSTGDLWIEDYEGKPISTIAGNETAIAGQIVAHLIRLERRIEERSGSRSGNKSFDPVSSQPLSFK